MANTPYYTKAEADAKNQQVFNDIKQTTESISAGEGGKSYATLADAQAVSPAPEDGTVFQVEEAANKGYWKFDSTQTGGTKFLRDFLKYEVLQTKLNIGNIYKDSINLSSSFPFWAIKEMKVVKKPNDINAAFFNSGVLRDIYITYVRKNGLNGATSSIIQIGEKVGSDVGVNKNVWASITSSEAITSTIENITLKGNSTYTAGLEIALTIDWSQITATYSLTTECPIYTAALLQESKNVYDDEIRLKSKYWLNPKNRDFNYNSFLNIEVLSGSEHLFYNNGVLRELYVTFIRFVGLGTSPPPSNIVEISWKDGSTVGLGDKTFATVSNDTRDMSDGRIAVFELEGHKGNGFNGLKIRITIDTSLVPDSILGSTTLSDSLQLDSLKLVEQLKKNSTSQPLQGKKVVCFGDSVTEFGDYPEQMAGLTGSETYKIGFGGCHLAERADSWDYNELGMVKIAEAIATQDFTDMETAVTNLANKTTPDDNTEAFNRLKSIDFSTVDFVTIFFGTNDFTGDKVIGSTGSSNTFEIYGAVNYIVDTLQTAYPNLKILFVTPTHRFFNTNDDSDLVANGIGKFLIEYCDAIIEEAGKNHTPTLDMYRQGGFNKYNHAYYFGSDNVHPNSVGYTYLAQKISAELCSLFKMT